MELKYKKIMNITSIHAKELTLHATNAKECTNEEKCCAFYIAYAKKKIHIAKYAQNKRRLFEPTFRFIRVNSFGKYIYAV